MWGDGEGRIAGLDVGDRTIGVALSDPLRKISTGLEVIRRGSVAEDLSRLRAIMSVREVMRIVVGLPRNMNGTYGPRAESTRDFAQVLERELGVTVTLWDERLTTVQAERTLLAADMSRRKRRAVIDQLAAQLILQSYLDARAARPGGEL